jgi:hypothetical protein
MHGYGQASPQPCDNVDVLPSASPSRAQRASRLARIAAVLGVLGCGDGGSEQSVPQAPEPTAEPAWNPQVRRPGWRFVFEKTGERCVVLRIDDNEHITKGEEAACPVDLQVGERIRLAGRTCMREGPDVTRVLPVVCPDPLTNAERDFLEEKKLLPR